jgi:uncharacterized protein YcbX
MQIRSHFGGVWRPAPFCYFRITINTKPARFGALQRNPVVFLKNIFIYPIKSMKGASVSEATVEERGLRYDRRWMLIDSNNRFISQREQPRLALMSVEVTPNGLLVKSPAEGQVAVPFHPVDPQSERVNIWDHISDSVTVSNELDRWFSNVLGTSCRLVQMAPGDKRPVAAAYAVNDESVSFADEFPFMLLSEGSVEELNRRLDVPVQVNRFRPNFVVSGALPFAEDEWKRISIGSTSFHGVKSCARCVMTTVDQEQGIKAGPEPLKTLAGFREYDGRVLFGRNLIAAEVGGIVRVGDPIVAATDKAA